MSNTTKTLPNGDKSDLVSDCRNPWEEWAGANDSAAPTNLGYNTIGFDGDGLGNMYQYSARLNTWVATGIDWSTFQGG